MDALRHLKAIGHNAAAKPLLDKAGVEPDAGVTDLEAFVDAAKQRYWDRRGPTYARWPDHRRLRRKPSCSNMSRIGSAACCTMSVPAMPSWRSCRTACVTGDARPGPFQHRVRDGARLPDAFHPPTGTRIAPVDVARRAGRDSGAALLVEDPDAPAPQPLVHASSGTCRPRTAGLAGRSDRGPTDMAAMTDRTWDATAMRRRAGCRPIRRPATAATIMSSSSSLCPRPLPLDINPGRSDLMEAIRGRVLAAMLVGTYSRGEEAPAGSVSAAPRLA